MATTTKSRAKKKTTKKTARQTQAKSVTKAAKANKKSVSTKVVKSTAAKKPVTKQLLNRLNVASGVLALALAAAAGFLMNHTSYQLFTGLLTKDELASTVGTVFVPAVHAVYDLELRWAVVVILVLSAVVPLLAATRNRKQYEASLAKKVMLWRWIDMAVISALMVGVIALISGVQDVMTLKLIGAFMVITVALGWFSEKRNATAAKPIWDNYILGLVTGVLPWLMIAAYAIGTPLYGLVRSPWYVYALYATTLLAFLGYVGNQMRQLKGFQKYEITERNYLRLGIFAKTAFAVILIVGLYKY